MLGDSQNSEGWGNSSILSISTKMFVEVHSQFKYFWNETFRYLFMKKENYFVGSLQGLCCFFFLFGLLLLFPMKMLKLVDGLELLWSNSQLMKSKSRPFFKDHCAGLETSFCEINWLHVLKNRKKKVRGEHRNAFFSWQFLPKLYR